MMNIAMAASIAICGVNAADDSLALLTIVDAVLQWVFPVNVPIPSRRSMYLATGPDTATRWVAALDFVRRVAFVKIKPLIVNYDFPISPVQQIAADAFYILTAFLPCYD
jgi:hypothetical protein